MPSPTIEDHARAIAGNLSLGFDPFSILLALLPEILKCLNPPSPEEVSAQLQREFDKNGGKYRKGRLNKIGKRAQRIARAHGESLTDVAAEDMAIEVCEYARTRQTAEVKAFGAAVGVWR